MNPDSISAARPVTGGLLVMQDADGQDAGTLPFEVWAAPARPPAPPQAFVVLTPQNDAPLVLSSSSVQLLRHRLEAHAGAPRFEEAGVGVGNGDLSMTFSQRWPLGPSLMILLVGVVAVAAAVAGLRGRRRARALQSIARHESISREAERTRVAREIHDGPLQDVARVVQFYGQDPKLCEILQRVSGELRSLAAGLRPPALDRLGLAPALHDLAERWDTETPKLSVRIRADEAARTLHVDTQLAVYRVAQEALSNAAEHGRASTAWVFLRRLPQHLDLVVRDDGEGLPPAWNADSLSTEQLVSEGHFGLAGMNERARALGGSLSLSRGPGQSGTEVRLTLPLPS